MSRWSQGEAQIEQQIRAGELQSVRGGVANGEPWLAKAERTLGAAATLVDTHRVRQLRLTGEGRPAPVMVQDSMGNPIPDATFMVSYAHRAEKGTEVNVASHLLVDVLTNQVDNLRSSQLPDPVGPLSRPAGW